MIWCGFNLFERGNLYRDALIVRGGEKPGESSRAESSFWNAELF